MANNNHFELTLDTLAPQNCTLSGLGDYEKENKALVFGSEGATFKKVWFDQEATPTKECAGYLAAEWQPSATAVESAFTATGIYYYHVVYMDDVNNESEIVTLGPVYYDQDKPVVEGVYLEDPRGDRSTTNSLVLNYGFNYSDKGAGVVSATISGTDFEPFNVTLGADGTFTGQITLPESAEDGDKQIQVVVYDMAGNVSLEVASNKLLLDRVLDKPTLLIQDSEGVNLPEFINYDTITVKLTSLETNIVEYQVWEGAADAYPQEWMSQEAGSLEYVNATFKLSSGDGEKVIHARIKDTAGNIKEADYRSVVVDTAKPTASLSIDKTIISKVEGFNKALISIEYADERSGIAKYSLVRIDAAKEETEVISGTGDDNSGNHPVEVGALADGIYEYRLDVEDKAGNKFSSNVVSIIFDTTAPNLAINPLNAWYTEKFNVKVNYHDDNNFGSMTAWVSSVENDVNCPKEATSIMATNEIAIENIYYGVEGKPAESAANYMHVRLYDEVGNVSYAHKQFGFDSVAPVIKEVKFTKAAYPTTAAEIRLVYEDATSGVVQMNVSGDITDGTAGEWEEINGTRFVTLKDSEDGMKSVTVMIRDAAGLTATETIECELDRTVPTPSIELYDAENANVKPSHSPLDSFSVRIKVEGDDSIGGCQYQIYGDFAKEARQAQGIVYDKENGWATFVKDAGQEYMTISGLFCTVPDGTKEVYVKVMDNAGNILKDESGAEIIIKKSFIYDTTVPVVTVSNIDHNRISKVHVKRIRNAECTYENCYADECRFTFTPDSVIQAYKVCAYMTQEAAQHGSAADAAIGTANGSVNMSASELNSNEARQAMIKGADFEAALGEVGQVDGLRWVVVYVQDLAGQWSVAAEFEA